MYDGRRRSHDGDRYRGFIGRDMCSPRFKHVPKITADSGEDNIAMGEMGGNFRILNMSPNSSHDNRMIVLGLILQRRF